MENEKKKKKKVKVIHKLINDPVDYKVILAYDKLSFVGYNVNGLVFQHYVKENRLHDYIHDPDSDLIKNQYYRELKFKRGDFVDMYDYIIYKSVDGKNLYKIFNKAKRTITATNIPFRRIIWNRFITNRDDERDMIFQNRSQLIRVSDLAVINCEKHFVWQYTGEYIVTCSYLPESLYDVKVGFGDKTIKLPQLYDKPRFKVHFSIYNMKSFKYVTGGNCEIENLHIHGSKISSESLRLQRDYVRDHILFPNIHGIKVKVFSSLFRLYGIKVGECCVCFERDEKVKLKLCGHSKFCMKCVEKIRKCPLCRADIINKDIVYTHV